MWRFLLISCILYRPVTSQHTITAINSSSRGAQWEAHYSHGYDSNSPPSSRDDSTTVKISFKQVSPKFLPGEYRTDLFLNFVLVQEWMDSRLKLNGVETGNQTVMNIDSIKTENAKIHVWKPSLITNPISIGSNLGDQTWLWSDGRLYRTQYLNLHLIKADQEDSSSSTFEYLVDIFSTKEFDDEVKLEFSEWRSISFKVEEEKPTSQIRISGRNGNYTMGYSIGKCEIVEKLGADNFSMKRSCLRWNLKLDRLEPPETGYFSVETNLNITLVIGVSLIIFNLLIFCVLAYKPAGAHAQNAGNAAPIAA